MPTVERVVATHPDPGSLGNPYQRLLHAELERRAFRFRALRGGPAPAAEVDLVHLNWLEFLVRSGGPLSGLRAWRRALRLLLGLRRARAGVVWTVHNLVPHEPEHPRLERWLARRVARRADALVVHSRYAAERVRDSLGRDAEVFVAPHAGYVGCLPEERRGRAELRRELDLP
jgi:beta-1,4-mannosyltransferase